MSKEWSFTFQGTSIFPNPSIGKYITASSGTQAIVQRL
jgi:hypothetical protein